MLVHTPSFHLSHNFKSVRTSTCGRTTPASNLCLWGWPATLTHSQAPAIQPQCGSLPVFHMESTDSLAGQTHKSLTHEVRVLKQIVLVCMVQITVMAISVFKPGTTNPRGTLLCSYSKPVGVVDTAETTVRAPHLLLRGVPVHIEQRVIFKVFLLLLLLIDLLIQWRCHSIASGCALFRTQLCRSASGCVHYS